MTVATIEQAITAFQARLAKIDQEQAELARERRRLTQAVKMALRGTREPHAVSLIPPRHKASRAG